MSFRRRVVLLAAGAVAAAIVIASVVVYVVTGNELRARIDASLRQKLTPGRAQAVQIKTVNLNAAELAKLMREGKLPPGAPADRRRPVGACSACPGGGRRARGGGLPAGRACISIETAYSGKSPVRSRPADLSCASRSHAALRRAGQPAGAARPTPGSAAGYVQLFQANGQVVRSETKGLQLPVTAATRAVAAGRRSAFFSEAIVAGTPLQILTKRAPEGGVWQVALPLSDVDNTLTHLKLVLALVCLGGIALAAVLGLLVSRTALIPVRRLTGAAERVARTQDLGHRIQGDEDDELGRLAQSFNTMLAALERSRLAQRQLVSDASHELRTPLTSVQANLDALAIGEQLPAHERARILAAAQAQLRELTVLVGDLVDLSKTEVEEIEVEDVRLDLAAAGALRRARLHAPQCRFVLDAEPCLVRAAPARLDRAIANLLDNACKWNPPIRYRECRGDAVRGGPRRGARARRRDRGPRPRPGNRRGGPPAGVRPLLPRARRTGAPRLRARAGDRAPDGRGSRRRGARRQRPGGGARLTLELPPLQMTPGELAASKRDAARGALG